MKNRMILLVLVSFVGLTTIGCGKKVTKVQTAPPSPPPVEQVVPPPVEDDSFRPQQMDDRMSDVFVPIYFEYDQFAIKNSEIPKLEKIASYMNQNGNIRVLIEGHCDERGSNEYNIGLGERRSRAIQTYLKGYGISDNRLEITSFGEERLVNSECQAESCHEKNRRGEWKVLTR